MLHKLLLLLALIASTVAILGVGRAQSIAVKGRLQCNGKPYAGALVKLYEANTIGKDTKMAQVKTGGDGSYSLSGSKSQITGIDPKINIYHDCNDGIKPCQRKFTVKLPSSYVTSGKVPSKVYEAGVLELAGKYPGESRDCLH